MRSSEALMKSAKVPPPELPLLSYVLSYDGFSFLGLSFHGLSNLGLSLFTVVLFSYLLAL